MRSDGRTWLFCTRRRHECRVRKPPTPRANALESSRRKDDKQKGDLEHRTLLVRCSSFAARHDEPRARHAGETYFFFFGAAFFFSALGGSALGGSGGGGAATGGGGGAGSGVAAGAGGGGGSGAAAGVGVSVPEGDAEEAALGSAGGGVSLDPPPHAARAVATASGAKSTTDFQVDMTRNLRARLVMGTDKNFK
jgi:hypothetical protein